MGSVLKDVASYYEDLSEGKKENLEDLEFTAIMLGYDIIMDNEFDWVRFERNEERIFDMYFGNRDFSIIAFYQSNGLKEVLEKYEYEKQNSSYWFEHLKWENFIKIAKTLL